MAKALTSIRDRVRINPAVVIALAAVIFAGGGGAYATTTSSPSVAGWAVVSSAGRIARGTGAVRAKRISTGVYQVTFNQDVTSCAYKATIGQAGAGVPSIGDIGVASHSTNAVSVRTTNIKGQVANYSFHLAVVC